MAFEFFKKKTEPSSIPVIPPENKMGRKTREEHKLECEKLIAEAVRVAAISLTEEIIRKESNEMIDKTGNSLTVHYQTGQATEGEIKRLEKEEGIEEGILLEMRSDRELAEILITIIERGEKSPKELGKVLLGHKELGKTLLDNLERKRLERRKKLIAEEERLAKKKWELNKSFVCESKTRRTF